MIQKTVELVVTPKFEFDRLDHYLIRNQVHPSRSYLQKLIREGDIEVNGETTRASYKIRKGDVVTCRIPAPRPLDLVPEDIPLEVLYEDPDLLIINKKPGIVVHPAAGHATGTLVHALLHYCRDLSGIGGRTRPGIVHRLDKDTSGVMVIAKTDGAHRFLSAQFKKHSIKRTYNTIVLGRMRESRGLISLAIGRDRRDRKKISERTQRPREAATEFRVLRLFKEASLLEISPKTGRTHQIRVHLASRGYPVLGDAVYGGRRGGKNFTIPPRQMLHAKSLGFIHPVTGEPVEFSSPLPKDMMETLAELEKLSKKDL